MESEKNVPDEENASMRAEVKEKKLLDQKDEELGDNSRKI